jgi:hypothetical protein
MATMFIISNTVQWSEIMYFASRTNEIDVAPFHNKLSSNISSLFFVITVVLGNFFLMNLFIGVIITKYNRQKELAGKDFMLTDE